MNSLQDKKISDTLIRLHREAAGDSERWHKDPTTASDDLVRMGELYLALNEDEGRLLYILARNCNACNTVEFGASYGVSTIYLGAAAKDNNGRVITTEAHPQKCTALNRTLQEAGLSDVVRLLEGDARETLKDVDGQVDFVFLDGWKGMYLRVLEVLKPKLASGALIVADNIGHSATRDYYEVIRSENSGFVSATVGKQEITIYLG